MAEEAESRAKVLVVEDHAALGEALLFAFGFEDDIDVVGLAPTVADAVALVAERRPDVVLMDVNLPDGNGIDATSRVLEIEPATAVIVLTAHADPVFALRAAVAGAAGFVPKNVRIARIVAAIRAVRAGEVAVEPTVLRTVLARAAAERGGGGGPAALWPPEQVAVLELLAQGSGTDVIAGKLGLDRAAADRAVAATLAAVGARSRLEAVVGGARRGLFDPSPD